MIKCVSCIANTISYTGDRYTYDNTIKHSNNYKAYKKILVMESWVSIAYSKSNHPKDE